MTGSSKWAGRKAMTARASWLPRVKAGGVPCSRCGKPVVHRPEIRGGGWDVDHLTPRWAGGTDAPANTWPAHARCNRADGGKRGAALTNARKPATQTRLASERARGIRGI